MADYDRERAVVGSVKTGLFIGGAWQKAEGGKEFEVEDPATGEVLAQVADGSAHDALDALEAATQAAEAWAGTAPRARGDILRRGYEAIMARTDDLALLMTLEMGKPLAESRAEVAYAAEFFRWFSEEAVRIDGRYSVAPNGKGRVLVLRQPVGPCVLITPWNFPMAMITRKLGPALAAGATAVIKPAGLTPLSTLALANLLMEVGLPPGVINVITTSTPGPTMAPLLADRRTRKLSFTGSTEVGRALAQTAAERVLRVSMELGGNAPFIVFGDADVDAAVEGAVQAKMRNMGEACTAANRFLVHESVAEKFSSQMAARLGSMAVGRGTDAGVEVGPLIEAKARDKVAGLVHQALDGGARALTGGNPISGPGYFFAPTVLADVDPHALILSEEVFGPVAPISTFATDDEALFLANATDFGLVAYAYTTNLDRAFRIIEAIETGMVGINQGMISNPAAPFGGVKQSGLGREGGAEGIGEYLEVKYAALNVGA